MSRTRKSGVTLLIAGAAALTFSTGLARGQESPAKGPDAAERTYLSANGLLNRGMYELAADEYRTFLDAAPTHEKSPIARYGLSVCLVRLKEYDEAAGQLAVLRTVENFQFAPEVGLLTAQCAMALEKYNEAAQAANQTVLEFQDSPVADDAAGILAEARYRTGDYAGARQAADSLAKAWPQSPARARADLIWGLSAAAMGDDREAAARLTSLVKAQPDSDVSVQALLVAAQAKHRLGDLDEARVLYEQVVERPVSDLTPDALLGLGTLLHTQGDLDAAGEALDRVSDEFASAKAAPSGLMERGRVWLDAGDVRSARTCFEDASRSGAVPGDQAAFWLARCDLRDGDAPAAATRLAGALDQHPQSPLRAELRFDMAAALVRAGDDRGAASALELFEKEHPGHGLTPDALEMHAGAEHRLGEYGPSAALCRRFLAEFPDHARTPEVTFLEAENALLAGDHDAAAAGYARVLEEAGDPDLAGKATFRLGTALYRLGRAEEAEPLLVRITDGKATRPEFRAALLCLGDAQFQSGRWAEAERTLGDYYAVARESADDALLKLGLCAARQNRPSDAVARFDELLSQFPQSAMAAHAEFEKGQSLVALDQPDAARAAFEGVLRRDPAGPLAGPAEAQLGNLAMARGDSDAGAEHFARAAGLSSNDAAAGEAEFQRAQALLAAGRYAEAAEVFSSVAMSRAGHPRQKAAGAQRAVALRRAGMVDEALAAFDEAERTPGDPLEPAIASAVMYERARALGSAGRTDEAAAAFRAVIADGTPDLAPYAMVELASIESEAGREAEAGRLLEEAAAGSASAPELHRQSTYRLAASLFKQDRYADAAKALDPLIEGQPSGDLLAPALRLRAQSRAALGQPVKAAADFGRLVREFPDDDAADTDLLGLGESLGAAQDWPGSEQALTTYLERFPSAELWFRARFGLGWARENQARQEEAMEDYAKVVAGHEGPTAARAQFQTGECLFALKRHEEAVRELLKVDILYAYPEWSAAALYEAGRCFAAMGKAAEAEAQFTAVTVKYPQTDWAGLASKELGRIKADASPRR